ncbi:gluconokinase [Hymenobacter caeli]|uniref:Gluconokinase n=1 Tax=Hymenobacter caeli TaxID=2735894 RepID=A0ABX2FN33_9BACT|nr:gluconokinase [Hymenobacter caeli]NRT18565.1 carbohydrate kinase (thermoresistant glucokinase family) [Hymenobacter caeli]
MNQPLFLVMGVSGSGKTTVGQLLAARLGRPFYDGDDFHPAANVAKMASGHPLTDEDRAGWLATLAADLGRWEQAGGAVLACSALKEAYRQTLQAGARGPLQWVFLDTDPAVLRVRLEGRTGHYMKADMLDSQLATLEKPAYGLRLTDDVPPAQLVDEIVARLGLKS